MSEHKSFATIFAVIGILTMIGGAYFTHTQVSFLNSCEKARGTVVDIVWKTEIEESGKVHYSYPIISFTDPKGFGTIILAQGRVGSNPPDYQIRDVVNILFDPREPGYVYRDDF